MVFLWAATLFIFLFTVPKQEKPEEKVWRELEESVVKQEPKKEEKPVKERKRLKLKDIHENPTSNFSSW